MILDPKYANLSPQQQDVIRWVLYGSGSLELMARAGCGKTFTLMKIVEAVSDARLGDIALMAYNKKIADELKFKLEKMGVDWRQAQAGTVHSFGFSAWRKANPLVRVDDTKVSALINAKAVTPDGTIYLQASEAISRLVTYAKQRAFGLLQKIDDHAGWYDIWSHFNLDEVAPDEISSVDIINSAITIYKESLNQCREVIDFEDMILAPLVFKQRFWQKKWVLVDESQDTNPARRALALAMLAPGGRLVFVGDDCQAIYGFTGADSDAMLQLKRATNATTLPLNVTFRCPKAVVALAQQIVPDFTAHPDAPEGNVRYTSYEEFSKEKLTKHDAVLCRNTAPLISTAYALLARGTACRVEGREIGTGLIKLATRWKIKTLDQLIDRLEKYEDAQITRLMNRGQERKIESLKDQLECLHIIITRNLSLGRKDITDLVSDIENMFGNTPEGAIPQVLTLSTIHKSKGREWKRVFILGRDKYLPSPYAKLEWQQVQESNLEYVALTRAMQELIDVTAPAV